MIIALLAKATAVAAHVSCDECDGEIDDEGLEMEFKNSHTDAIWLCSNCKAKLARAIIAVLR